MLLFTTSLQQRLVVSASHTHFLFLQPVGVKLTHLCPVRSWHQGRLLWAPHGYLSFLHSS